LYIHRTISGVFRTIISIFGTISGVLAALIFVSAANLLPIKTRLLPPGYAPFRISRTALPFFGANGLIGSASLSPACTYRIVIPVFLVLALAALLSFAAGIRRTDVIPAVQIIASLRGIGRYERNNDKESRQKSYLKKTEFFH
jgi:hypothetical protein